MRASGTIGILVYCADYRCSHSIEMSAGRWSDDLRLSDIEPRFVCKACGKRGADGRRQNRRDWRREESRLHGVAPAPAFSVRGVLAVAHADGD